jgi:hypothetical protein
VPLERPDLLERQSPLDTPVGLERQRHLERLVPLELLLPPVRQSLPVALVRLERPDSQACLDILVVVKHILLPYHAANQPTSIEKKN